MDKQNIDPCLSLFEQYKQCIYKNNDQYVLCKTFLEQFHKCDTKTKT